MIVFRRWLGLACLLMVLLLTACGNSSTLPPDAHEIEDLPELEAVVLGEGERLRVVATTSIVGDVVAQVGGDGIELTVLLAPGQDPHAYQPSAQELGRASKAHIIFVNGFDLEESLLEDLESATEGVPMVPVSAGLELLGGKGHDEEEDHSHNYAQNPHVWFNVSHVERWTDNIEQLLSALDSANAETYTSNGQVYKAKLAALDEFVRETVNTIPEENRKLVTNHDAFAYLAEEYGFEIIGTVIPTFSTNAEPSASDLSELIKTIKKEQAPAIFIDSSASHQLAQVVSDETGAAVFELYTEALGAEGSAADSYLGMMRTNIESIQEGLAQ